MKGWNISAPFLSDEEAALVMRPPSEARQPTEYEWAILKGLQQQRNVFQGPAVDNGAGSAGRKLTVEKIAARRVKGKAARLARRDHRKQATR